jgi:hypothetical protein
MNSKCLASSSEHSYFRFHIYTATGPSLTMKPYNYDDLINFDNNSTLSPRADIFRLRSPERQFRRANSSRNASLVCNRRRDINIQIASGALSNVKNEWIHNLVDATGPDNGQSQAHSRVIIGSPFDGLTLLNSTENGKNHKIE